MKLEKGKKKLTNMLYILQKKKTKTKNPAIYFVITFLGNYELDKSFIIRELLFVRVISLA